MDLNRTFNISPDVTSRALDPEVVILDLASGTYFGLDPVGARVWQLLSDGKTIAEVYDLLLSEFCVSRDVLEQDVLNFLSDLEKKRLII